MSIGSKVKIIGTQLEGIIVQRGNNDLVRLDITKGFNTFIRTVYSSSELEEIE